MPPAANGTGDRPLDLELLQTLLRQPLLPDLGVCACPLPFEIHSFDCVASTNQTLWQLLQQTGSEGVVAIARQQTAGRGQRGRRWQSAPGGLYLSAALCPNLAAARVGELMVCSAWGIAAALRCYEVPVELKWPNDLVLGGKKLGGILLETRIRGDRLQQAVIGVGINWTNPTPPMGVSLRHLVALPHRPMAPHPVSSPLSSLEMLAAVTLHGIRTGYQIWLREGMAKICPAYESLLSGLGATISLPAPHGHERGEILGITPTGQLRVRPVPCPQGTDVPEVVFNPGDLALGYAACPDSYV